MENPMVAKIHAFKIKEYCLLNLAASKPLNPPSQKAKLRPDKM